VGENRKGNYVSNQECIEKSQVRLTCFYKSCETQWDMTSILGSLSTVISVFSLLNTASFMIEIGLISLNFSKFWGIRKDVYAKLMIGVISGGG